MCEKIRRAISADIEFLIEIERQAASTFPRGCLPNGDETFERSGFLDAAARGNILVYELDQKIVGFLLWCEVESFILLQEMDVLPQYQNRGIGAALINSFKKTLLSESKNRVYLTTFSHIPWNAPFYSRHGFVELLPHDTPFALNAILQKEQELGFENRIAMRCVI